MWMSLILSLMAALALATEVSIPQDVGSLDPSEKPADEADFSYDDLSFLYGPSRPQILFAQYECYLKIIHEPLRTDEGPFCNRTWDGWLCWDDSAPGTSTQMCPSYFMDFDPEETATKICNSDGQWFQHPASKRVWTNYTLCSIKNDRVKFAFSLYYLIMAGHGISIVSLIISLIIFSYLKSLSCQRISLHKNMFISFIFNSVFTMWWLSISFGRSRIMSAYPVSCKILAILVLYTYTCNFFWMLCEGIYLHTLIIVAVFVGEQQLFWYYVLGWVFPLIPAITYAVARAFYHNDWCWIGSHSHLLFIIHGPIHAALFVNLFFLLNVIRVLITKLRKTHCAESTAYMKAVRATLILIPLLGVQHILMTRMPDINEHRVIYVILTVLSHFQGLLVSIVLCFCNAEAQTALRRKWVQWKIAWGKTGLGETPFVSHHFNCHTTSSIMETSRATGSAEVPADVPAEVPAAAQSQQQTETCQLMPEGQQKTG